MRILRSLLASLLICITISSVSAQTIMAVKVKPAHGQSAVWILRGGHATSVPGSTDYDPLSWSSDGRWVALGKPTKSGHWNLSLVDTTAAVFTMFELKGDCSAPSWAPDGKSFVASVVGSGLRTCALAGSDPLWSPLLPAGSNPCWAPSTGRIAFVGAKGEPSGWIVSDDGANPHAFFKKTGAVSVSWSPDSRNLAFVIATKSIHDLVVVNPAGTISRTLTQVDGGQTAWSPDAKSILARQKGQWVVVATQDGAITKTGLNGAMPQWLDSKSLTNVASSGLNLYQLKTQKQTPLEEKAMPDGKIESFAAFRGLVLDGQFDNPWKKASPPHTGQLRLIGTVQEIEFEDETAKIKVWSVMTPDGMELHLATPLVQGVQITGLSTRARNSKNVRLSPTDLIADSEIMLLVRGTKAGVPENLNIEHALIPDIAEETEIVANASARPTRSLDSDGVCMDHVVVDLTFPVLGKVNWSDTFLASRGGGRRRHHGQDLMAPKMRPLVATFDGTVRFNTSSAGHNTITLKGDNGWTAVYMHVNNDHPGTDDAKGGARNAFAPGLKSGDRVVRGQLVGFCGDSGNAESTGPHCHFELHDDIGGGVLNATPSLQDATQITEPVCQPPVFDSPVKDAPLRWDAMITKVDTDRKVVVAELISEQKVGLSPASVLAPRVVYIKVGEQATIALRADAKESRGFKDLRAGQYLSISGEMSASGDSMEARHIGIGLSFGR